MDSLDAQIYEGSKDELVRYASVLAGPELAQEVVSTAVGKLVTSGLSGSGHARLHLYREVLREARAAVKRRGQFLPPPDPSGQAANWNLDLWDAVQRLPVRQRAATFLFYWAEASIADTALLMDASQGTVKRYLRLARLRIEEVLDGQTS